MTTPDLLTPDRFTPTSTRAVLAAACHQAGIDPAEAELLRHQTAAVYRLAGQGIVVKIGRPEGRRGDPPLALTLAGWLSRAGLPVTTPALLPQPLHVSGCQVTFWNHLPQPADRAITAAHLGVLLRQLHQLEQPPIALPELDPVAAIRHSIRASRILHDNERRFLTQYAEALVQLLDEVQYVLPAGLIHGDPQHRNALWDGDTPVLVDWDSAANGPREWDLVTVEVHCRRFGYPDAEYRTFASAYGYDVRTWPDFPVVRDLRELRMITTNARKSSRSTDAATEVHKRVAALRECRHDAQWSIL